MNSTISANQINKTKGSIISKKNNEKELKTINDFDQK